MDKPKKVSETYQTLFPFMFSKKGKTSVLPLQELQAILVGVTLHYEQFPIFRHIFQKTASASDDIFPTADTHSTDALPCQ